MSVSSIPECTLPFCGSAKEQTNFSRGCRITAVVLGAILLIAGIVLISGAFGNFNIVSSYACAAIGLVALAIGSFTRCVKQNKVGASDGLDQTDVTTNLSSLPSTSLKSDFLPHTPLKPEEQLLPSKTLSKQSESPPSSMKSTPVVSDFLPHTPLKSEEQLTPSKTLSKQSESPPSSMKSTPVVIVKQPTQSVPKLVQFQEGLLACNGHLNQFQILLDQRGIFTKNIYDGNHLHNYLTTSFNNLSHPVEGPPSAELLMQWVSLIDAVKKSESALCSAFFSHYEPDYKPQQFTSGENKPHDSGGLKYNSDPYSYEYKSPSVKTKSPKVEYKTPKFQAVQGEVFTDQELTCFTSISKSLNVLYYWLAEGFYSCNLRNEACQQVKQNNILEIRDPFFFKLARDYYHEGDRLNAVKMLKEIYNYNDEKENFFYRLAVDYYQEGDKDNAIKMIKETYRDTDRKENFFYRLAEDYHREHDRENAVKMIKEIYRDTEKKESFFFKLAENYCQEGNKEMAAKMLKEIYRDTKRKEAFLKEHSIRV